MSKLRFTDCDKWDDPWFMELPPDLKLLWGYLCDKCDNAGVWNVNGRLAEFATGLTIDWPAAIKAFDGRIQILADGRKWHLTKFVAFQYPGGLSNSNPHKQVARLLASHGIVPPVPNLKATGGLQVGSMEPPRLDKTIPLSLSSGGVGEDFRKFLRFRGMDDSDRSVDELTGFAHEHGATCQGEVIDCIDSCQAWAKKDGSVPRWRSDLAKYGPIWRREFTKDQIRSKVAP